MPDPGSKLQICTTKLALNKVEEPRNDNILPLLKNISACGQSVEHVTEWMSINSRMEWIQENIVQILTQGTEIENDEEEEKKDNV